MKPRLLLVEDDDDIRELLALALEDAGFQVLTAPNGREALDCLTSLPAKSLPSVLLLDLMMPVMDGRDFLAVKDRNARLRHLPVLVLTAVSPTPALHELPDHPSMVMGKPLNLGKLLEAVRQLSPA